MSEVKNVPKLRFPGFEGEWKKARFDSIASFISGNAFKSDYFGQKGVRLVTPKNFTKVGEACFTYDNTKYTTEECSNKFICREDDLLILLTDLTQSCELLGRPLLLKKNDGKVLLNQRILKVDLNKNDEIGKTFLKNFLLTENYLKRIRETSAGSTVRHSSTKTIAETNISFPTFVEQKNIGNFFAVVDELIFSLNRKKTLLEKYKKGMMQKIFNQELRFKDDNGKDFGDWELNKTMSNLIILKYGKDQKEIISQNGKYPILGTGGEMGRTNEFLCNKPSVLIGRKGTIDKPMYLDTPFWTVDTLFYSEIKDGNFPKWIYFLFQTINWYLYNEASGVPSLSTATINKIGVKIPSLKEQTKIANFLSAIDDKINQVATQIEKMDVWKKGLLGEMFV